MTGWTCKRVSKGVKCGQWNQARRQKCYACAKPKPAKRKPAHMRALDMSYEDYIVLNGGEFCGICGKERKPGQRRLQRDHQHKGDGIPRGLLCPRDNIALKEWMTVDWLRSAMSYLETVPGRLEA